MEVEEAKHVFNHVPPYVFCLSGSLYTANVVSVHELQRAHRPLQVQHAAASSCATMDSITQAVAINKRLLCLQDETYAFADT